MKALQGLPLLHLRAKSALLLFILNVSFFLLVSWESGGLICAKASFSNVKLQTLFSLMM